MVNMPKKETEFFDAGLLEWKLIEGYPEGAYEKILSFDEETGAYTRLLKIEPGVEIREVLEHDFCEEVFIVKGDLTDKRIRKTFTEGMYACRQPGMKHGPYISHRGFLAIEVRYYGFKRKGE